jgi:molybdopterin synthase sulfur carrier subunit
MNIRFFATLRPIVGGKQISLDLAEGTRVHQLIDHLIARYPDLEAILLDESGTLSRHVHIFVDGRSAIYLEQGLDTPLSSEQRIDVFPAVAGG